MTYAASYFNNFYNNNGSSPSLSQIVEQWLCFHNQLIFIPWSPIFIPQYISQSNSCHLHYFIMLPLACPILCHETFYLFQILLCKKKNSRFLAGMVRKRSNCGEISGSPANLGRKYCPSVEKYRIPIHAMKEKTNQVWEILGVPSQDVKEKPSKFGKIQGFLSNP